MAETLDLQNLSEDDAEVYTEEIYDYLHESNYEEEYLTDDFELDQLSLSINRGDETLFEVGLLDEHVYFVDIERNATLYVPNVHDELNLFVSFLLESGNSLL